MRSYTDTCYSLNSYTDICFPVGSYGNIYYAVGSYTELCYPVGIYTGICYPVGSYTDIWYPVGNYTDIYYPVGSYADICYPACSYADCFHCIILQLLLWIEAYIFFHYLAWWRKEFKFPKCCRNNAARWSIPEWFILNKILLMRRLPLVEECLVGIYSSPYQW